MDVTALPRSRPLTYDDLAAMPDDGHRYELVDGVLIVTPAPGVRHQVCVLALAELLRRAREPGHLVLVAPFDVVPSAATALQPDVLVTRREDTGEKRLEVAPLLAVEVASPSTRRLDVGTKRLAYEAMGVPSYWVVDPDVPSLVAFELRGGAYEEAARAVGGQAVTLELPFPVTVVPARLLDDLAG